MSLATLAQAVSLFDPLTTNSVATRTREFLRNSVSNVAAEARNESGFFISRLPIPLR